MEKEEQKKNTLKLGEGNKSYNHHVPSQYVSA